MNRSSTYTQHSTTPSNMDDILVINLNETLVEIKSIRNNSQFDLRSFEKGAGVDFQQEARRLYYKPLTCEIRFLNIYRKIPIISPPPRK